MDTPLATPAYRELLSTSAVSIAIPVNLGLLLTATKLVTGGPTDHLGFANNLPLMAIAFVLCHLRLRHSALVRYGWSDQGLGAKLWALCLPPVTLTVFCALALLTRL